MALFNFSKKQEAHPICACQCGSEVTETVGVPDVGKCCDGNGICCIKVLGAGCRSCHALYENTKEAVQKMGLSVEVEYVTDMQKVMEYGVMSMPALVVNEKAASMGKVLKPADIEKLLHKLGF